MLRELAPGATTSSLSWIPSKSQKDVFFPAMDWPSSLLGIALLCGAPSRAKQSMLSSTQSTTKVSSPKQDLCDYLFQHISSPATSSGILMLPLPNSQTTKTPSSSPGRTYASRSLVHEQKSVRCGLSEASRRITWAVSKISVRLSRMNDSIILCACTLPTADPDRTHSKILQIWTVSLLVY